MWRVTWLSVPRKSHQQRVFVGVSTYSGPNTGLPAATNGRRETPNTTGSLASRVDSPACAFRPIWRKSVSRKVGRSSGSRSPARQSFLRSRIPDLPFSPHGLRERAKGTRRVGESMSTHAPTGCNWPDAMRPLEARRRARAVGSFAEYVAKDIHGDRSRALEAIASLARRRPVAVDASVLRRAARHARRARGGRR